MVSRNKNYSKYRKLCGLLRQWRRDANLTQRALAERLGALPSYVAKTEIAERRIYPIELRDWAKATGVSMKTVAEQLDSL